MTENLIISDFLEKDKEVLFSPSEMRLFWSLFREGKEKNFENLVLSDRNLEVISGLSKMTVHQTKKNLSIRGIISYTVPEKKGGRGEDAKTKYSFCAVRSQEIEVSSEEIVVSEIPQEIPQNLVKSVEKEKKEVKKDKAKVFAFAELKQVFMTFYKQKKQVEYYFQAKDAAAIKGISTQILFHFKENGNEAPTVQEIADSFEWVMENGATKNKWYIDNLSLAIVNSKFNEITALAKNTQINGNTTFSHRKQGTKLSRDENDPIGSLFKKG